jgi:hypothetical protein
VLIRWLLDHLDHGQIPFPQTLTLGYYSVIAEQFLWKNWTAALENP